MLEEREREKKKTNKTNDYHCETVEIYNLNMRMCKLSCKHKIESDMISMSDENQDKK